MRETRGRGEGEMRGCGDAEIEVIHPAVLSNVLSTAPA